ncbi:MAG: HmuY family protein [Bacteroidota bacterium]
MMKRIFNLVIIAIVLSSCMKEEIAIEPNTSFEEGVQVALVDMGNRYPNQVYFNLVDNEVVASIERQNWTIAFKNGSNSRLAVLNDAQAMSGWASGFENLESATDSAGFGQGKKIEVSAEIYEEPALEDLSGVYLIDLGFSEIGLPLGAYWIEFPEVSASGYQIRYKKYGQEEVVERFIEKNEDTEFVLYSLEEDFITHEPTSSDWDFKFTRYISVLDAGDSELPYSVTGVILNPYNTWAAEFSEKEFEKIELADTTNIQFSNQPDIIGFDWKTFTFTDGTTGIFTVDSDRSYVIRNALGAYYKLRFLGFYGEGGYSGEPSFEYQLLR